ncbi:hypothetical protein [Pyrobaculum aerophilum]|uniref:hypothetical protein n=1 Tax=Pyrobaculum aerophilum TaxID=13773 RepID=UPI0015F26C46|nr:hypothetical protein [Pyrobaculum aerophilum]
MECPACGNNAVIYNGVEYVCSQCTTVLGVEFAKCVKSAYAEIKSVVEQILAEK